MKRIPQICLPGVSQADFQAAYEVLDRCIMAPLPSLRFPYGFIAPGGAYGNCWWQLDSTLALSGCKWYDIEFAKNALRNFITAQKPDGRIPLYGLDGVHVTDPGTGKKLHYTESSSLPKLFAAAYEVFRLSGDVSLLGELYPMLKNYLEWWLRVCVDERTGLVTSVFEETFAPYHGGRGEYAAVDTNVEVAAGCKAVGYFAKILGKPQDEEKYAARFAGLRDAINAHLWNPDRGEYANYFVKEDRFDSLRQSTAFQALRFGIAPQQRRALLLERLKTEDFNWEGFAVTTAARSDPAFTVVTGKYKGNFSWSGDVWTLRNVDVIHSLRDSGFYCEATRLTWKTVQAFNNRYWEFLSADDGTGHGEADYAWTASQYLQLIIEELFGVQPDLPGHTLTIAPNLPPALQKETLWLRELPLGNGDRISVEIAQGNVRYTLFGGSNLTVKLMPHSIF